MRELIYASGRLDQAIKAVCPIVGVSIGDKNDKSTWRVDFAADATTDERDAAEAVLHAFDLDAPEHQPAPPRDLAAEVDMALARIDDLEATAEALLTKGILTQQDIEEEKSK